jgi:cbb3-type cytochrome oxidase maturation protein
MKIIFFLILVSVVLAAGFLIVYIWAARNGQFDDDYTPAMRILFDDASVASEKIIPALDDQPTINKTN